MIPQCVICKVNLIELDINKFQCPSCKREYIMDYEILAYDDSIGTAHDEEAATIELEGIAAMSGPRLETKKDELEFSSDQLDKEKPHKLYIKIPDYMKDTDTKKVVEYEEK